VHPVDQNYLTKIILTSFLTDVTFNQMYFAHSLCKVISVQCEISACLESLLENTRFLKAEIINSLLWRKKDEEILVSFVVTGAGHGLQCVSLRG
jgi:hypothetical protein